MKRHRVRTKPYEVPFLVYVYILSHNIKTSRQESVYLNGSVIKPVFAGLAMAFSSVSVVSNSLRLKVKKL